MLANSEDPDQTPLSAASDLGMHCLPMSQKWDDWLVWVNEVCVWLQEVNKRRQIFHYPEEGVICPRTFREE